MDNKQKAFQQKVKNRKYAIDHSWRGKPQFSGNPADLSPAERGQYIWEQLEENLHEADLHKMNSVHFPITSHRRRLGKVIVFAKKAVRKLFKIFLGWFIYPLLEHQNVFNGKLLNTAALERELLSNMENRINVLESSNQQLREELAAEIKFREAAFSMIGDRVSALSAGQEAQKNEIARLDAKLVRIENLPTSDDMFYHHFEEKFRGSRQDIINRLGVYVPVIKEHLPDWSQARFIDIGSGRGEWMDILRYYGATDYVGVDLNEKQNAIAESCGHKTVCADCIEYLKTQADDSVDLISGIQIIEHLCMSDLMELLKQSHRVLKKGGMILFETPNPRNIVVGADTFYIDPSHKRSLDPRLMEFFAEWSGFASVKVIDANANPLWESLPLPDAEDTNYELVKQFNNVKWLLFGPMDYALFAVKE